MNLASQLARYSQGLTTKVSQKLFGYDAVKSNGKRTQPSAVIRHEDTMLRSWDRKKMNASARDAVRNHAIISWMLNKHLDSVATFTYNANSGFDDVDERLEWLISDWSKRKNCDNSRRHSLQSLIRLNELNAVLDGDSFFVFCEGGKLALFEGNQIARPDSGFVPPQYVDKINDHGLIVDEFGAVTHYCVCDRVDQALIFKTVVPAELTTVRGYYMRPAQYRGVSPLAPILNATVDIAEICESLLVKAKLHSFLGVAIYSDAVEAATGGFGEAATPVGTDTDGDGVADTTKQKYDFSLKPGLKLELEKGDKVDMMESSTPATSTMEYLMMQQRSVLHALSIPYSMWDSTKANYSGRKMDMVEYAQSIKSKQDANKEVLDEITEWVLPMLVLKDEKIQELMSENSLTVDDLVASSCWVPAGRPWIDESQEIQATIQRISAGLSSRTVECKKRGVDWKEVMEDLEAEQKIIEDSGVPVVTGQPGQQVQQSTSTAPEEAPDMPDDMPSDMPMNDTENKDMPNE